LNIDAWIARPGSFEYGMNRSALAWRAEEFFAQFEQVSETNISGSSPHRFENLLRSRHTQYGATIGTTTLPDFSPFAAKRDELPLK
jgi:hypothetical protein